MNNKDGIYTFPGDKERQNIENIKLPRDILKIIRDTRRATFKCVSQFTPENIYSTFLKNDNTLIEKDNLFSNYAFYFWERFLNSRFDYSIEGEENLEKVLEGNRNKIGNIIISPHDSSVFESLIYGHILFQNNKELFENTYNVPRLGLMNNKSNSYGILMMKSIITLSLKDSYKYGDYKRFIASKSVKSILEKSSSGNNIHMFPEGTKRVETMRGMNPIVDGFVKLLNKKIDRKQVKIMTSHITELTAWKSKDILKKHNPKVHFGEPVDISYVFDNNANNIPDDFELRYKKANVIQGILELKKEFIKRKNVEANQYMQELVKEIDQDSNNIDKSYDKIGNYWNMISLPKYMMSWFQTTNRVPDQKTLLQSWQVGRFIAEKIPNKDKGIYKLDSDIEKNCFEKDEKTL